MDKGTKRMGSFFRVVDRSCLKEDVDRCLQISYTVSVLSVLIQMRREERM